MYISDRIIDFIYDEDDWIKSYINMTDDFGQYIIGMIFSEKLYDIYNYMKYGKVSNNLDVSHPYFDKLIQVITDAKLFDKILESNEE